jgi:hypothetical protein
MFGEQPGRQHTIPSWRSTNTCNELVEFIDECIDVAQPEHVVATRVTASNAPWKYAPPRQRPRATGTAGRHRPSGLKSGRPAHPPAKRHSTDCGLEYMAVSGDPRNVSVGQDGSGTCPLWTCW